MVERHGCAPGGIARVARCDPWVQQPTHRRADSVRGDQEIGADTLATREARNHRARAMPGERIEAHPVADRPGGEGGGEGGTEFRAPDDQHRCAKARRDALRRSGRQRPAPPGGDLSAIGVRHAERADRRAHAEPIERADRVRPQAQRGTFSAQTGRGLVDRRRHARLSQRNRRAEPTDPPADDDRLAHRTPQW